MATRETMYTNGEDGYNAMISDFSEMFDWDNSDSPTDTPYTDFKKNCGENVFVSLRVLKPTNNLRPNIRALVSNNGTIFQSNDISTYSVCTYAYGSGFFVCCSSNEQPTALASRTLSGLSSCRNIITGETGWLTFSISSNTSTINHSFSVFSKDSKKVNLTSWSTTYNSKIGGAVALHDPATGWVSDKIMMLTALPDNYTACLAPVIFNGSPYTRIGHLLVPSA